MHWNDAATPGDHQPQPGLLDDICLPRPAPERIRLKAGTTVQVDSLNVWVYVLVRGRLRVGRIAPSGRRIELGVIESLACMLAATAAEEVLECLEECELIPLSKTFLSRLAGSEPLLVDVILEKLGERLLDHERRLDLLAYSRVADRIAFALLRMRDREGRVAVTHKTLAGTVGASRETVTKALDQLQDEGVVRIRPGQIRIVAPGALIRQLD